MSGKPGSRPENTPEVSGLRVRQRQKRFEAMLAAAERLIQSRGYPKMTMEAIAAEAEVGVATVYNYFRTKEQIVVELFRPYLQRSFDEAERVMTALPPKPSAGVAEILRSYRHLPEKWDHSLLRTFASVGIDSAGPVGDLIAQTDGKLRVQIKTALKSYAKQGKIRASLNIADATEIIFALFNQFYYQFLVDDSARYPAVFAKFTHLLPVVFSAWESTDTSHSP